MYGQLADKDCHSYFKHVSVIAKLALRCQVIRGSIKLLGNMLAFANCPYPLTMVHAMSLPGGLDDVEQERNAHA